MHYYCCTFPRLIACTACCYPCCYSFLCPPASEPCKKRSRFGNMCGGGGGADKDEKKKRKAKKRQKKKVSKQKPSIVTPSKETIHKKPASSKENLKGDHKVKEDHGGGGDGQGDTVAVGFADCRPHQNMQCMQKCTLKPVKCMPGQTIPCHEKCLKGTPYDPNARQCSPNQRLPCPPTCFQGTINGQQPTFMTGNRPQTYFPPPTNIKAQGYYPGSFQSNALNYCNSQWQQLRAMQQMVCMQQFYARQSFTSQTLPQLTTADQQPLRNFCGGDQQPLKNFCGGEQTPLGNFCGGDQKPLKNFYGGNRAETAPPTVFAEYIQGENMQKMAQFLKSPALQGEFICKTCGRRLRSP